jgi:hypothetical protein
LPRCNCALDPDPAVNIAAVAELVEQAAAARA